MAKKKKPQKSRVQHEGGSPLRYRYADRLVNRKRALPDLSKIPDEDVQEWMNKHEIAAVFSVALGTVMKWHDMKQIVARSECGNAIGAVRLWRTIDIREWAEKILEDNAK